MYHVFSIHSPVEGYLGYFQVVAILSNAAMNIVEQMSLLHGCVSFGYIAKSGIVRSCGRLIPISLRNCHTDLQNGCTNLHSHYQWRSVPLCPHPLQHKLSLVFLILVKGTFKFGPNAFCIMMWP